MLRSRAWSLVLLGVPASCCTVGAMGGLGLSACCLVFESFLFVLFDACFAFFVAFAAGVLSAVGFAGSAVGVVFVFELACLLCNRICVPCLLLAGSLDPLLTSGLS